MKNAEEPWPSHSKSSMKDSLIIDQIVYKVIIQFLVSSVGDDVRDQYSLRNALFDYAYMELTE